MDRKRIGPALFVILALVILGVSCSAGAANPLADCVEHQRVGMHYHTTLTITVDGVARAIPQNVGITSDCMRPLHTHDPSGVIHIEHPSRVEFTLGDFLTVWQEWGDGDPLGGLRVTRVVVDGKDHTDDLRGVALKDGRKIILETQRQ